MKGKGRVISNARLLADWLLLHVGQLFEGWASLVDGVDERVTEKCGLKLDGNERDEFTVLSEVVVGANVNWSP